MLGGLHILQLERLGQFLVIIYLKNIFFQHTFITKPFIFSHLQAIIKKQNFFRIYKIKKCSPIRQIGITEMQYSLG